MQISSSKPNHFTRAALKRYYSVDPLKITEMDSPAGLKSLFFSLRASSLRNFSSKFVSFGNYK